MSGLTLEEIHAYNTGRASKELTEKVKALEAKKSGDKPVEGKKPVAAKK